MEISFPSLILSACTPHSNTAHAFAFFLPSVLPSSDPFLEPFLRTDCTVKSHLGRPSKKSGLTENSSKRTAVLVKRKNGFTKTFFSFRRLIFIHLQCWEVLPFCRFQRQRCIKILCPEDPDFYTPLALKTAKGQHLPALEVYKNQSPILIFLGLSVQGMVLVNG